MATTLKIPSKTGADNFNLQDLIDDFNTIKTALDSLIAGNGITDKGIVKAKLEQSVQDTLGQVATNTSNIATNTTNITSNTTLIGQAMPSGAVLPFAMNTAPSGWLKCNGQVVSRTTYAKLFTAIGTLYGSGDGSTTFALPDLRGEFIRGFDDGRGVDTGRNIGTAQSDTFKSHIHHLNLSIQHSDGAIVSTEALTSDIQVGGRRRYDDNVDSNGGTETRPRNIALLYCIKC